jgi:hypothetical protein
MPHSLKLWAADGSEIKAILWVVGISGLMDVKNCCTQEVLAFLEISRIMDNPPATT